MKIIKVMVEVDHTHDNQACTSALQITHSQAWYDYWGKSCPVCSQEAVIVLEEQEQEVVATPFIRQKSETDKLI